MFTRSKCDTQIERRTDTWTEPQKQYCTLPSRIKTIYLHVYAKFMPVYLSLVAGVRQASLLMGDNSGLWSGMPKSLAMYYLSLEAGVRQISLLMGDNSGLWSGMPKSLAMFLCTVSVSQKLPSWGMNKPDPRFRAEIGSIGNQDMERACNNSWIQKC